MHSMFDQHLKGWVIDGSFGKPHGLGSSMESLLKIGNSPEDLGFFISVAGQGHDDVVINLRNRIPVAKSLQTVPVRLEDLLIDRRKPPLQPGEERGAKIETDR